MIKSFTDRCVNLKAGGCKAMSGNGCNGCDIFTFAVRHQATDRGFGMLCGDLTMEGCDKGLHKGVKTRDDVLENLRGNLTFFQPLAFAKSLARFHGTLLL